jgi:muconate cycloisomerase
MADDLPGMATVAAATDIAIGADEGIHSLEDIRRHHERKAARGVSLKAIKLGGVRALAEAGRLCDRLGMSVNISCKTGESSVACAAATHVAAVNSQHRLGTDVDTYGAGGGCRRFASPDRQGPRR